MSDKAANAEKNDEWVLAVDEDDLWQLYINGRIAAYNDIATVRKRFDRVVYVESIEPDDLDELKILREEKP